jgi:hypothetical protein
MHGFERQAELVLNGGGRLLERLAALEPGECGVADVDLSRRGANAWVVGVDDSGCWWESRVELDRDGGGRWVVGASSTSSWEGGAALAEPASGVLAQSWGLLCGLVFESGRGSASDRSFSSVRGIATAAVAAIELSVGNRLRRRVVDSPTGAFIVAVPAFDPGRSACVRGIRKDGSTFRVA